MVEYKEDLLEKLTLKQLKEIADEKKIQIKPSFWSGTIRKVEYINQLSDSNKVSKAYIKRIAEGGSSGKSAAPKPGKKLSSNAVASHIQKDFHIHRGRDSEKEYERDFLSWARGKFGNDNVVPQFAVGRTQIDAVICGVGVELKFPKTPRPLMTLRGQVEVYQKHFGRNLIVLLFSGKCEPYAINEFKQDMKKRKVLVVDKK